MSIIFNAVGDWGYNNETLKHIAQTMKKNKSDFLALLGDNFYPFGISSNTDKQWNMFETNFGYLPCYAILGNHDYLQNPYAQITYHSKYWHMPFNFYDIRKGNCHFFFIDTHILAPNTSRFLTEEMGCHFIENHHIYQTHINS